MPFFNPQTGLYEQESLSSLGVDQAVVTAFGVQLISTADAAAAIALLGIGASGVVSVTASSASPGALAIVGGGTGAVSLTFTIDATLVALAGLISAADQMIYSTGTNLFAMTNLSAYARTLLSQGSAGNWRTDLGLSIGGNVQAWSADLDAFVTNASWSGVNLTISGNLLTTEQVQGGIVIAGVPTTVGDPLFQGVVNSVVIFRVSDEGAMILTSKSGYSGDIVNIGQTGFPNLFRLNDAGDVTISGSCVASGFAGDGGGLTGLSATALTGGTVANARLDADLQALGNNSGSGLWARTGAGTGSVRSMTGTAGTITVTNGDGVAANPTFTIASSYVGQATITTLGTISTGLWQGTTIGTTYGGLGLNNGAANGVPLFAAGVVTITSTTGTGAFARAADPVFSNSISIGTANIYVGTGDPDGNVAAAVGSLFLRTDGGAGTTIYAKETGAGGDSGWSAL